MWTAVEKVKSFLFSILVQDSLVQLQKFYDIIFKAAELSQC